MSSTDTRSRAGIVEQPSELHVVGLTKIYDSDGEDRVGRLRAINDVSLSVSAGEFFTLLGPSGCGKTTLLRCIGGLEQPQSGSIELNGKTLYSSKRGINVPIYRRNLGMVFQSYAIWPHMTVFENAAYPLRVAGKRLSSQQIREVVERNLEILGIGELSRRNATELSGGQQQRLALARVLVQNPPLLLLDEPLSNLDANRRESMRAELKKLQSEFGLTVIYVTHDQSEALAMSTQIAVLNEGVIDQVGTPSQVYDEPATRFVGEFVGRANFVTADIQEWNSDGTATAASAVGRISIAPRGVSASDRTVSVLMRPHVFDVDHLTGSGSMTGTGRGVIESVMYLGEAVECRVRLSDDQEAVVKSDPAMGLRAGDEVGVSCRNKVFPAFPLG